MVIKPATTYELFGGRVTVLIYGKSSCCLEEHHVLQIARDLGLKHIYHPDTHTFNARICNKVDLEDETSRDGVTIHSGCLADGVGVMGKDDTVWLRTADCPTIITYHSMTREMIVAHAGRASLIDEGALQNGQAKRQPESVVGAICARFSALGQQTLTHIDVYSCCGIGPMEFRHPTDHPQYGPFNKKRNRHVALHYGQNCFFGGETRCGALDLHRLIYNQFQLCGVPGDNIHHDSLDVATEREYFFSRRGGDRTGHNSVLIIRR